MRHAFRLSTAIPLAILTLLLGTALYGCGSSGSSASTDGTSFNPSAGAAGQSTPSTLSGLKGNVVIVHSLAAGKTRARKSASSQGVPPEAVTFVYTGYDSAGHVLYGPMSTGRRGRQVCVDVPVEVVRIHVDYDSATGQHLAFADIPVKVLPGGTVTVYAAASSAFEVQLVNDSGVPDSDVYVLVAANPPSGSGDQVVSDVALVNTAANTFTPAHGESSGHGSQLSSLTAVGTVASTTRPNTFNTVRSFTIENLVSGRVYVTYGNNPLFTVASSVYQAPSADANFRWDVMELTVPQASPYPVCYADLTSIQFLGIPMQLQSYADADSQQGLAQPASNNPQAGSNVAIDIAVTDGIVKGSAVAIGDSSKHEVAIVSSVAEGSITVGTLKNSYTAPYVTLVADSALQTRTFYASMPTILNAVDRLDPTDNRMQWAFQAFGTAPAPPPNGGATPTPSCSPGQSPSPTPTPSPGPNVAVRGYFADARNTWLQPQNVGQAQSFLRVQGPQTTVSEPWQPASPSPDPSKISGGDPNSFVQQRPYRAYPYPTFAGYVKTMVGSCYNFGGANSCGGPATMWSYGGTVTQMGEAFLMTLDPLAPMSPNSTLGCGPGSSSGVSLPTDLPVSVALQPNDVQNEERDLDFIVYSTPGGVFEVSVPCNLNAALDNSVYANIADDALAGLQFGYINGQRSPNDGTVWFAGFPSIPPFGAARSTNDGLYNPYAAIIYNFSDSYGFPYSDRIANFNPLLTTTNQGTAASRILRVTLLNDLRPDAPSGLALASSTDGTSVTATWNKGQYNANNPTAPVSYAVTISDGLPAVPLPGAADQQTKLVTGSTACTFSGLHPGTTYVAYVTATYPDGSVSSRSALANVLTAGTAAFTPSGTSAKFDIHVAWNGANLSNASNFTLNVAGQQPQPLNGTTPVTVPVTGAIGTNYIPFTITTPLSTYPSVVPPLPGSQATVVDAGAFVVTLDPASGSTFNVTTAYMTDGSPVVIPAGGPYNDDGSGSPLILTATLSPGQAGTGSNNNVVKVVSPVAYAIAAPTPPSVPYACPTPSFSPPVPAATPCPPMTFMPTQGLPGSQVQITLYVNGNLQGVSFNGVPGTIVSSQPEPSPDQRTVITAQVPYNATASGRVEVDTDLGKSVSLNNFALLQPTFTVSPAGAGVGDPVTLTAADGFDFSKAVAAGSNGATATVQYGTGCNAASDTHPTVNGQTITTTVPLSVVAGANPLSVLLPNGVTAVQTGNPFTVLAPMFSISPSSGPRGGTVTLTPLPGSDLTSVQKVTFAGSTSNVFTKLENDGTIIVTVPSDATTGFVTVTDGQFVTGTSSTQFTVTTPGFTVAPTSAGYSDTVTLTSDTTGGFKPLPGAPTVIVAFGSASGTTAVGTPDGTNTTVTVTVPNGATSGNLYVTGTFAGPETSTNTLTITHPAIPGVTPFNPASGPVGSTVVITGTGFNSAVTVFFTSGAGVVPASTFHIDSATQITTTVPSNATTGPVKVTDATNGGTASTVNFTVTP
jgi:hypothetical protein